MRWPLFTWILAGGIFSMFWFVYLSIEQNAKHWKPVAQYFRRHRRPPSPRPHYCKRMIVRRTV